MKKVLAAILFLSLFLPPFLGSWQVHQDEVLTVIDRLIRIENSLAHLRLTKGTFTFRTLEPLIYKNESVGYIVHLDPQGFMIISEITEESPLKFVSYSGDFEGIKDHPLIVQIMERLLYSKVRLNYVQDENLRAVYGRGVDTPDASRMNKNALKWKQLLSETEELSNPLPASAVAPLLMSTWNQLSPYNSYTPLIGGQPTYTGCCATAQAQVMHFWKYPLTGQGSNSYSWNGGTLSANFNHAYYWDRMLNNYTGSETPAQIDAVARLMSDVGISMNMYYGTAASSAYIFRNNPLVSFFKYSPNVTAATRASQATWDAWFSVFKSQLDKRWPAILITYKPGMSHAVVIDGYRTTPSNQVHVNMGWPAYPDNYYDLNNVYGYGDATQDYAVINIHPPFSKDVLLCTFDGQGVYYMNMDTGLWTILGSPANLVACGDLDGDGIDDLIGVWPTQGGVWVKYSKTGAWAFLASTARGIAAGDMNGDGRKDLVGTWDSQGVFYRDSVSGTWVQLASPASSITTGDLDGDGIDDPIGIWPGQGGVWVKYSKTGAWAFLSTTPRDIAVGDMNGDGRKDLVGTWDGQGVFYRDSVSGTWVQLASPADLITTGDLDGDGIDDLIGLWSGQGGVWVKYSTTGAWAFLSSTARDISAGNMTGGVWTSAINRTLMLQGPQGGYPEGPAGVSRYRDLSADGPRGSGFFYQKGKDLIPTAGQTEVTRVPGPGESGFTYTSQDNLEPREPSEKAKEKRTDRPKKY